MNNRRTPTVLEAKRRAEKLSYAQLAKILGKKSRGTAWRYCLPTSNAHHQRPDDDASRRLRKWSRGAITIANYADPARKAKAAP
jgi:hypothetical protein